MNALEKVRGLFVEYNNYILRSVSKPLKLQINKGNIHEFVKHS